MIKTLFRNLLNIISRFKVAYIFNLLGTAVALAGFMAIMIQVKYEINFDDCHSKSERIFRLEKTNMDPSSIFAIIHPRGYVDDFIKSSPHIEEGAAFINLPDAYFLNNNEGNKLEGYKSDITIVSPSFGKIFDFDMISGSVNCLLEPQTLLIPQSMAKKIYGRTDVIGKNLVLEGSLFLCDAGTYSIGGVYKDFPENTQLRNCCYTKLLDGQKDNYWSSNFSSYILLDDPKNAKEVAESFNHNSRNFKTGESELYFTLKLLPDVYFNTESGDENGFRTGNKAITILLFCIALIVLLISIVNLVNFNTALVPMRIKCINAQKVLGASCKKMRWALTAESGLYCIVAWIIGIMILGLLHESWILSFLNANLSPINNINLCVLTGLLSLLIGLLAGIYPSRYLTSFNEAIALKGNFGVSPSGRVLRRLLIGFQFAASFVFIAAAMFIGMQNHNMLNSKAGLNAYQVLFVQVSNNLSQNNSETYINKLKDFPGIENVAFSRQKIGASDSYSTYSFIEKGNEINFFAIMGTPEILDVFGIDVIDGLNFEPNSENSEAIISERLAEESGFSVNDKILDTNIRGICKNVNLGSMRIKEKNTCYICSENKFTYSYIRLAAGTNVNQAMNHIKKTIADIDPAYPTEIEFYDDILNKLYSHEISLASAVAFFSLLAIIISIIGIFGMVVFDCEYRHKEIGVRRVMGANINGILYMFNKAYIKIMLIAFVIAMPITIYFVYQWLQGFAYRIPIYWWVFAIELVIIAGITIATVSFQTMRAANMNPVDSLKTE